MKIELYIQTVREGCAFLEEEGYTFHQLENNIYFTKETKIEGFRISFSWLEYGDKFITQGLSARKRFNIVEQEIQKVLGGELDYYYTIHKSPTVGIDYIPDELEYQVQGENIRFTSNEINDIELFIEVLKKFYSKTVLDFFMEYESLDFLNNRLKELLEMRKIQSVLTSIDNTTILRLYVIAFLSKNEVIKEFFKETYFPYLKNNVENELKRIELNRFKLLQDSLTN
jgi:hypothetical protein